MDKLSRKISVRPSHSEVMLRLDAVPKQGRPKKIMPRFSGATIFLAAVLCLSCISASGIVLAEDPPAGESPAPTSTERPKSVPESFNVNEYLTTPDMGKRVPDANQSQANQKQQGGVIKFLLDIIDLFVKIIGSIALVVFIIGALLTVTSGGKEDRLERGKTTMVYAIIGLVVTFLSFIIVALVQSLFF